MTREYRYLPLSARRNNEIRATRIGLAFRRLDIKSDACHFVIRVLAACSYIPGVENAN